MYHNKGSNSSAYCQVAVPVLIFIPNVTSCFAIYQLFFLKHAGELHVIISRRRAKIQVDKHKVQNTQKQKGKAHTREPQQHTPQYTTTHTPSRSDYHTMLATTTLCWWRRQGHKLLSPFTPAIYQNLDSSLMFHKMEWDPVEVPSNTHPFLCFEIYQLSTIWICICDSNA
jgi:hypothetical protein